jgi:hypothetical protein
MRKTDLARKSSCLLATISLSVVLVGCSLLPRNAWDLPANVQLTVAATQTGNQLVVTGTSDQADGTIISLIATGDEGDRGFGETIDKDAVLTKGRYMATFDTSVWPTSNGVVVSADLCPWLKGQPKALVDRYGRQGERLQGPGTLISDKDGSYQYQVGTEAKLGH